LPEVNERSLKKKNGLRSPPEEGVHLSGSGFRAIVLDLDGTLHYKGRLIPGADRALDDLREAGYVLRFLTNYDSKGVRTIYRDLDRVGLDVDPSEIFCPAVALRRFLEANRDARCMLLLSNELREEFAEYEADGGAGGRVDYVVMGDFRDRFSYDTLNEAFRRVLDGAGIVALQMGRFFQRADGPYLDTGAFVRMLEDATGRRAVVLGKPSPEFFCMCLDHAGVSPGEAVVVGDDVTTDVAGARAVGAFSVLVRTGKYGGGALSPSDPKPDVVIESVASLPGLLCALEDEAGRASRAGRG